MNNSINFRQIKTYSCLVQLLPQLRKFCSDHLTDIFYHHGVALQIPSSIQTQTLDFGPEIIIILLLYNLYLSNIHETSHIFYIWL